MLTPLTCHGPVLCQADGIWYCPLTDDDEYDCEECRDEYMAAIHDHVSDRCIEPGEPAVYSGKGSV